MLGFGKSKRKVEKRLSEIQKSIDPKQAKSDMSMATLNAMSMAAMSYDAVNHEYQASPKGRSDRKRALSSLNEIAKDVKKAQKK